jgi:hypothetical protein
VLARQGVKRRQRPFRQELAEMVRYAVGYRTRGFVTFGTPMPVSHVDPDSRRDVLDFSHAVMRAVGRIYKVLPTAVVAAAMRPSITRRDLEHRAEAIIETLRSASANLGVSTGEEAVDAAAEPLEARGIIVAERGRFRVRERNVLRYYARTLHHLLTPPDARTH